MTWPDISGLVAKMQKVPPVEYVVSEYLKIKAPKPFTDQVVTSGLKVKKGKIKRGDTSR